MDEQRKDRTWRVAIYHLEPGEYIEIPGLPLRTSDFVLWGNILHKVPMTEGHRQYRLPVPNSFVGWILTLLHDAPQAGHPGRDACLSKARTKYFWVKMQKDIEDHVAKFLYRARY